VLGMAKSLGCPSNLKMGGQKGKEGQLKSGLFWKFALNVLADLELINSKGIPVGLAGVVTRNNDIFPGNFLIAYMINQGYMDTVLAEEPDENISLEEKILGMLSFVCVKLRMRKTSKYLGHSLKNKVPGGLMDLVERWNGFVKKRIDQFKKIVSEEEGGDGVQFVRDVEGASSMMLESRVEDIKIEDEDEQLEDKVAKVDSEEDSEEGEGEDKETEVIGEEKENEEKVGEEGTDGILSRYDCYAVEWYKSRNYQFLIDAHHLPDGKLFQNLTLWHSILRKLAVAMKACGVDPKIASVFDSISEKFANPKDYV